jgi:hypothetical protein
MSFPDAAQSAGLTAEVGKNAIEGKYRPHIEAADGIAITHSADIDAAYTAIEPNAARWDYGVGLSKGNKILAVWVEPHGATSSGEVDKMIAKLNWLKGKLNTQRWANLRAMSDASISEEVRLFWWLVPGKVCFRAGSKEALKLAQAGLTMPCKQVLIR